MQFTYYGHSCFEVVAAGKKILFDPFITPNGLASHIDINAIAADYLFVSHGHEDHLADLISIAQRTKAQVVSNFEIVTWITHKGINNTHAMNTGGQWRFDFGSVKCTPAQHSSSLPDGSYGGNPMGFLFATREGNFYYSGDTALTLDMQLIPRFAKLDFAVFPIGDNFTMGIDDAIAAAEMVQSKKLIGVHYNTFESIRIDQEAAKQRFRQAGLDLLLPGIGERIQL